MKKSGIIAISFVLVVIALSSFMLNGKSDKIGFVKVNELIYNYKGMKVAQNEIKSKKLVLQTNLDSLVVDYNRGLKKYTEEKGNLSVEEQHITERVIKGQEQSIANYRHSLDQKLDQIDQNLTDGILTQINSFVKEYGKKNGFKVIFGANNSGNIMYAEQGIDLTEEVLEELNLSYSEK